MLSDVAESSAAAVAQSGPHLRPVPTDTSLRLVHTPAQTPARGSGGGRFFNASTVASRGGARPGMARGRQHACTGTVRRRGPLLAKAATDDSAIPLTVRCALRPCAGHPLQPCIDP